MLVVTTERVAGYRVTDIRGQCFGVVVRSRGLGGNIMAGLRSIVRRRDRRVHATARGGAATRGRPSGAQCHSDGGNAVLMMRFDSAEIGQTMSEIVAYGTAAVIEREPA
jgi:uncharacterized protein YbjQ (UPF0145 family)